MTKKNSARFSTLEDWLTWQESLHPVAIELKLERIAKVAKRMGLDKPDVPIITVAGTNGKGSSVSLLNAILLAEGYSTGFFTSPHISCYNERIGLNHGYASDELIMEAFARIDEARAEISLTYFEFAALAAMDVFIRSNVDVVILEVGLGGRLDAVNIWDAALTIITTIAIDHSHILGDNREAIGREKAGIMRAGVPIIYGETDIPDSIRQYADEVKADLQVMGQHFNYQINDEKASDNTQLWRLQTANTVYQALPQPALKGVFQYANAATVISALETLQARLPISEKAIHQGLKKAHIEGRLELLKQSPDLLVDVGHNPHAVQSLTEWLKDNPIEGETRAIFSMLGDKDIQQVVSLIKDQIDAWHIVPLTGERAAQISVIKATLLASGVTMPIIAHESVENALQEIEKEIKCCDRILGFGSFLLVSEVKRACRVLS